LWLISRVQPGLKDDVEKYIHQTVEDKRAVDRKTIRELLEEMNLLNAKISSIEEFSSFINSDFDKSANTVAETLKECKDNIGVREKNNYSYYTSNRDSSKDFPKNNRVILSNTSPSRFSLFTSFLLGCIVMLLCIFIDGVRNLQS
jgi:hypothetical protein